VTSKQMLESIIFGTTIADMGDSFEISLILKNGWLINFYDDNRDSCLSLLIKNISPSCYAVEPSFVEGFCLAQYDQHSFSDEYINQLCNSIMSWFEFDIPLIWQQLLSTFYDNHNYKQRKSVATGKVVLISDGIWIHRRNDSFMSLMHENDLSDEFNLYYKYVESCFSINIFKKVESNKLLFNSLGFYYPYRNGNNPDFDAFSDKIMQLKKNADNSIKYFNDMVANELNDATCFTICIVPPSKVDRQCNGIKLIVNRICNNDKWVNGSGALKRIKDVDKKAFGGIRDAKLEYSTILFDKQYNNLIQNKHVLLLDDVYTTGTSMNVSKRILIENGAACVALFPLAISK
jgi:hypothetical protein